MNKDTDKESQNKTKKNKKSNKGCIFSMKCHFNKL
jgi:hypothetical protein